MKTFVERKIKGFKDKLSSKGVILMYHRVVEIDYDPWSLAVSPKNFEEHLKVLKKRNLGISLNKMADQHKQKKMGFNSLALTFDDGYGDNYYNAKPLLEKYRIPATFFITTASVDHKKEFWWDELENILFSTPLFPEKFQISALGKNYFWDLTNDDQSSYTYQENLKNWRVDYGIRNGRQRAFLELWNLMKSLKAGQQEDIMTQLRKYANTEPRDHNFPMTSNQLLDIGANKLFSLGAHTCNHPSLPTLSFENQLAEILGSINDLENLLNCKITTFSYPYGDYTEDTTLLLDEQQISVACTTESKAVSATANRLALPRFQVMNWSGEEFDYRLNKWFNYLNVNNYFGI